MFILWSYGCYCVSNLDVRYRSCLFFGLPKFVLFTKDILIIKLEIFTSVLTSSCVKFVC